MLYTGMNPVILFPFFFFPQVQKILLMGLYFYFLYGYIYVHVYDLCIYSNWDSSTVCSEMWE